MPREHGSQSPYEICRNIVSALFEVYNARLRAALDAEPRRLCQFTGFLIAPERIVIHLGRSHVGIEYYGPERLNTLPRRQGTLNVRVMDYSLREENFMDLVIGFPASTLGMRVPLGGVIEDLVMPSLEAAEELTRLGWNFSAQSMILTFGAAGISVEKENWARLVNARFFTADQNGLHTRHIKWIDFIPLVYDDSDPTTDSFQIDLRPYELFIERDLNYVYPIPDKLDFRLVKLPRINRFIETFGDRSNIETDITRFLARPENVFILMMKFGAVRVCDELECHWQSENRDSIKPDFFVVQPNGFANIVEFKLPNLKHRTLVGPPNRITFSAEIASYVSQTRTYRTYFDDPNNRNWFKAKYGFDVFRPRRVLVAGRRFDFPGDVWKEIADDHTDLEIMTYDDLIDGVVTQFYTV